MSILHVKIDGSSNIDSVGYDPEARVCEVRFLSGNLYAYHDVPPETHEAFMRAESKGGYFSAVIRKFRTTELGKAPACTAHVFAEEYIDGKLTGKCIHCGKPGLGPPT